MKETNWNDCLSSNSAKEGTPDRKRAESLTETAKERMDLVKEINAKNCNFVFEDYYTSLLEILQAKAFRKGYNITNHICIGFYIRDILKKEILYNLFDDVRFKRNSLTYYGNRMDFETAKQAIEKCKRIGRTKPLNPTNFKQPHGTKRPVETNQRKLAHHRSSHRSHPYNNPK